MRQAKRESASPVVDILLATRNGERFVGEQIASVQVQTHRAWRLLVSDDCSIDATLDVVRAIAATDGRIQVVSSGVRYGSAQANFMALLRRAADARDSAYVMFCDQDDVWMPHKIKCTLARMRELEAAYGAEVPLLVFSDMAVVDEGLALVAPSFMSYSNFDPSRLLLRQLLEQNMAAGCAMMLNRPLARLCAEGDASRVRMHDWWAMLVAAALGYIAYVDEPLSLYRQHAENDTGAERFQGARVLDDAAARTAKLRSKCDQAELLDELYGERLSARDRRCVQAFAALGRDRSHAAALRHLAQSRSWKRGGKRKLGQVLGTLQLVRANREA